MNFRANHRLLVRKKYLLNPWNNLIALKKRMLNMRLKFCSKHLERMLCSFYIPDYILWKILSYTNFYCILVKLILLYSNPTLAVKPTHLFLYLDLWKSLLHTIAWPHYALGFDHIASFTVSFCVGYSDSYVIVHICKHHVCTCVYKCEGATGWCCVFSVDLQVALFEIRNFAQVEACEINHLDW